MARSGWMARSPHEGVCPLCGEQLGGGNQRTNPLSKWRRDWAHQACVLAERGE